MKKIEENKVGDEKKKKERKKRRVEESLKLKKK